MVSYRKYLVTLLLCYSAAWMSSCDLINPEEEVPSFLQIEKVHVSSNYFLQGDSTANIDDVWVYADGNYIGTFELPAQIPILLSGKHRFFIGAGIEANGIASTSEAYPLYRFYETDIDLKRGEVVSVDSVPVAYFPNLQYTWFEDFEKDTSGSGISIDTTALSIANIRTDSVDVFEGKRSLKMSVTSALNFIECRSVGDGYQLAQGRDIYLEMTYKANQAFTVGLLGTSLFGQSKIPVIKLNPKSDWNKIYIRLGPYVNANPASLKYNILFQVSHEAGLSEGVVVLDNVKLISN